MNAELFYLVGKPNGLKQKFVSQFKEKLTNEPSIVVPEVYTTDEVIAEGDNYKYLQACDFNLRASMGMYSLSWGKNQHQYGISADIIQRLNTGIDVVVNGSLHNLEQATRQFPNINTVIIVIGKDTRQKNLIIAEYVILKMQHTEDYTISNHKPIIL